MKIINIILSDTNYTHQAATGIELKREQFDVLKTLFQKIEAGLYEEDSAYIAVDGLLDKPVKLTITEFEQAV